MYFSTAKLAVFAAAVSCALGAQYDALNKNGGIVQQGNLGKGSEETLPSNTRKLRIELGAGQSLEFHGAFGKVGSTITTSGDHDRPHAATTFKIV